MDSQLARQIAAIEDEHWWYAGRRRVLESLLSSLNLPEDSDLLDAGCGSGGNLSLLSRFGNLVAFEPNAYCRHAAATRGVCEVRPGSLPRDLPYDNRLFDLITFLDVLEHVEDEARSIAALKSKLKKDARLVVTVPAYQLLWSKHDEANYHFRRYTKASLVKALASTGLVVEYVSYFNTLLFPGIAAARLVGRLMPSGEGNDLTLPPAPANRLLAAVFGSERHLVPWLSLPFGVSVAAVAANPTS